MSNTENNMIELAKTIPVEFLPLLSGVAIPVDFGMVSKDKAKRVARESVIVDIDKVDDYLSLLEN
jgi:hypothetical protein